MLRAPAAALSCLLITLTPAFAAASERAPRVALVAFDDEVGLDPRAIADMAVALRGSALEEDVEVVSLAHDDVALGDRCDDVCLDDLADQLGATVLLTGLVTSLADGRLQIALDLRRVGEADTFQRAVATGDDTAALVDAVDEVGRDLLASLRPDAPAPPFIVQRTPVRRPYRGDIYDGGVAAQSYDDRSVGLALALEILFPGAGLGYAGDWGGVALEYVGIFTGFLLVMSSVDTSLEGNGDVDGMSLGLGLALLVGARLYGIVRAPIAANAHNAEYRRRLLEERGARLDTLRLRAPEIGVHAPAFTSFSLPPVTF